ncbi:hypothetical protein AVEN_8021-1 [Araneus ventricosus]|uniref:Uncharacterized protein n=1 Tax=Araneus ventricosus TaxID=182803 RepID=A0A4Y2BA06_ARAVE|nr:hypothetical protein AVEN_8021-1 [Araneus ventricosus]
MEMKLSYSLMLSLKEISLRRVAVILRNQIDIFASFDTFEGEDEVKNNLSELEIPPLFKEQMMQLVQPIGSEIRKWNLFRSKYLNYLFKKIHLQILDQHYWTILGTVDYRKTEENLIRLEMLDIVERYSLACPYFLDDYIQILWDPLPEDSKRYFYNGEGPPRDTPPPLEFCLLYILS